jgi:hypothetical protein
MGSSRIGSSHLGSSPVTPLKIFHFYCKAHDLSYFGNKIGIDITFINCTLANTILDMGQILFP